MSTLPTDNAGLEQGATTRKKRRVEGSAHSIGQTTLKFPASVHGLETLFRHVQEFHEIKTVAELRISEARRSEHEVRLQMERAMIERLKLENEMERPKKKRLQGKENIETKVNKKRKAEGSIKNVSHEKRNINATVNEKKKQEVIEILSD